MTAPTWVKLPGRESFDRAEKASVELYDLLEVLTANLKAICEHFGETSEWPSGVEIDVAYIGELYSFVSVLDNDADEIRRYVEEIRDRLDLLVGDVRQHELDKKRRAVRNA